MVSKIYTIADFQRGGRLYEAPAISDEENKALEAGMSAIRSLEEMGDVHQRIFSTLDRLDRKLENSEKKFEAKDLANKDSVSKITVAIVVAAVALTIFFAATIATAPVLATSVFFPGMWILYEGFTIARNYQHILEASTSTVSRCNKITYLELTKNTLIAKAAIHTYYRFKDTLGS